jgi:hypothetical protein
MSQRPYRLASILGAGPLLAGILVYLAWRATWWDGFALLGLAVIGIGCVAFLVGVLLLARDARRALSTPGAAPAEVVSKVLPVADLLAANFPAALLLMLSASDIHSRYTVRVQNATGMPVADLVLHAPGIEESVGPMEIDGDAVRHLRDFEGAVEFSAEQSGRWSQGTIDGYVTGGFGDSVTLRLEPNDRFRVRNHRNPEFSLPSRPREPGKASAR